MGWNKGGYKGGYKGGSKDSFNDFKGVGKGDFNKGVLKGDGQGKAGKGGGSTGYCHWCGDLGHSQSRCQKDEFMENRRNGKGNSKGYEENKNQLENLEIWELSLLVLFGTWQSLCYFELVPGIARTW